MERLFAEAYRLRLLKGLEHLLESAGFRSVAGVDEAGRGCLAGPVVAAAVVVDPGTMIPGVDDSKVLSAELRAEIAQAIRRTAIAYAVVHAPAELIDRINILQATRWAMGQALASLRPVPDAAVIDAVKPLGPLPFPTFPVIRGDAISYAVACASILAKVERDRYMAEQDECFPVYGFAAHKGYGAPEHRRALSEFGPCPLHRLTFASVLPRRSEFAGVVS